MNRITSENLFNSIRSYIEETKRHVVQNINSAFYAKGRHGPLFLPIFSICNRTSPEIGVIARLFYGFSVGMGALVLPYLAR